MRQARVSRCGTGGDDEQELFDPRAGLERLDLAAHPALPARVAGSGGGAVPVSPLAGGRLTLIQQQHAIGCISSLAHE